MELNEKTMEQLLVLLNSQDKTENEKKGWKSKLTTNSKGNVLNDIDNYILFLTQSEKYKDKLKYNEFLQQKEIFDREFNDFDLNNIYNDCERATTLSSHSKIDSALSEVFDKNRYNPVVEYLNKLKWDGEERCAKLFINLLDADDTELNRSMTMKWFLAAVKRIIEPGCKFDNILVLQGSQGIGKSSICEIISKNFFNTISLAEIGTKDLVDKLNKTWIAIIDELDTFNKKEMSTIKTFLSLNTDSTRLAYGRNTQTFKRHCVFIGSTNDETFLRDSTSSVERRFWIIKCNKTTMDGKIRQTLTKEYVNQLWAEATYKFKEDTEQYLDIDSSLRDDFANTMREFKTYNDDLVIDYIKTILERPYSLNEKGEFSDDIEFLNQYNNSKVYDCNKSYINKIPMSSLIYVLKNIYKEERSGKYIALALSNEWEYKSLRYGEKVQKGLIRKEPKETVIEDKSNGLPF